MISASELGVVLDGTTTRTYIAHDDLLLAKLTSPDGEFGRANLDLNAKWSAQALGKSQQTDLLSRLNDVLEQGPTHRIKEELLAKAARVIIDDYHIKLANVEQVIIDDDLITEIKQQQDEAMPFGTDHRPLSIMPDLEIVHAYINSILDRGLSIKQTNLFRHVDSRVLGLFMSWAIYSYTHRHKIDDPNKQDDYTRSILTLKSWYASHDAMVMREMLAPRASSMTMRYIQRYVNEMLTEDINVDLIFIYPVFCFILAMSFGLNRDIMTYKLHTQLEKLLGGKPEVVDVMKCIKDAISDVYDIDNQTTYPNVLYLPDIEHSIFKLTIHDRPLPPVSEYTVEAMIGASCSITIELVSTAVISGTRPLPRTQLTKRWCWLKNDEPVICIEGPFETFVKSRCLLFLKVVLSIQSGALLTDEQRAKFIIACKLLTIFDSDIFLNSGNMLFNYLLNRLTSMFPQHINFSEIQKVSEDISQLTALLVQINTPPGANKVPADAIHDMAEAILRGSIKWL